MKSVLLFSSLCCLALSGATNVYAQRDAPVWDSHLGSTSVYKSDKLSLNVDLVYRKTGGPIDHTEHQLELYACLDRDVPAILKIADRKSLLDKQSKEKQFLDVLLDAKLLTKLESKVAKRSNPRIKDDKLTPEQKWVGAFQYRFQFANQSLFESAGKLSGFDPKKTQKTTSYETFDDKFRIIAFVPVNDSKYSTKVADEVRASPDFAHFMDIQTPILYFKPLAQRFQFNRTPGGEILLYID